MEIRTKKRAKELGFVTESVLLNKYSRIQKTQGVTVKGEVLFHPNEEEVVRSVTAWKREGRKVNNGEVPVGTKHIHRGKSIKYSVYTYNQTQKK